LVERKIDLDRTKDQREEGKYFRLKVSCLKLKVARMSSGSSGDAMETDARALGLLLGEGRRKSNTS